MRTDIKLIYAEIGVDADKVLDVKSAHTTIKVPTTIITEELPQWLNIKNYKQDPAEGEINGDIVSTSKAVIGLLPHSSKSLGYGVFIGGGNTKEQIACREQEVLDSDKACQQAVALVANNILKSHRQVGHMSPYCTN